MSRQIFVLVGEEATRGTKQITTVGAIPLADVPKFKMEFDEKARSQTRGDRSSLGVTAYRRYSGSWSGSLAMEGFTQAGTVVGMIGTILKHFFGKAVSTQNGVTGQYTHMMSPVVGPFDTANLGDRALTIGQHMIDDGIDKSWPFVGGRVKSLALSQEPGQTLKVDVELFGQFRDPPGASAAVPVFPAENLRMDYNGLKLYTGTIARTGTAPNYTQFAFGSAIQIKPDKFSIKMENGQEDVLRCAGVAYPDKTRANGVWKVSCEISLDWADPASGFSSHDEFEAWALGLSETNFCAVFDTGTIAGTGDNHMLIVDMPKMKRNGGDPDLKEGQDSSITLSYEGLMDDTTTKYMVGLMLKNAATAV